MKILLQVPGPAIDRWHAALAAELPDAEITLWPAAPDRPDYALVWKPPAGLFAAAHPSRAVFNLGAGVEALLAVPTLPRDVPIVRLEDAGMAVQMAEYVTMAVLRAYREMDAYAEQQRGGEWRARARLPKSRYAVGILGLGTLGQAVASALVALGFPVRGWTRHPKAVPQVEGFAGPGGLSAFLAGTCVLVCLLPATATTRGLLDRRTLALLPRGAHVVNVARGEIVDDDDLLQLIDAGHLAGAVLDVFRVEPLPPEHPFWHHPKIVVTPHVSAVTLVADSIAQVAAKIRRFEAGQPVSGIVDRARGY